MKPEPYAVARFLFPEEAGGETYCSRARVGDLASVLGPLVVVAVFVGKRSVEDVADVGHGVHAHRRALEHGASGRKKIKVRGPDVREHARSLSNESVTHLQDT